MIKESVITRPVRPEDGSALDELAAQPGVVNSLALLPGFEDSDIETWISDLRPGHHRFVALRNNRLVGLITLMQHQRPRRMHTGTIGILVGTDQGKRKVISALLRTVVNLADNWLNLWRIDLSVMSSDLWIRVLFNEHGFEVEGMRRKVVYSHGEFRDALIMSRIRGGAPTVELTSTPDFSRREDVTSISIREIKEEDADELHEIISDPAVARSLNQIPSLEITGVRQKVALQNPGLFRYSAVTRHNDGTEKMVGNVTVYQLQNPCLKHSAGLGISVHREYWGLGIGQRLMAKVIDLADNQLGLQRLELEVYTDNLVAIHLYKKYGFKVEGICRLIGYGDAHWSDSYIMARLLTD